MIIVLEGVDGVGKSTQAELLAGWLRDLGNKVDVLHQPGSTPLGDHLRAFIKRPPEGIEIDPIAERMLFQADHAAFVHTHLKDLDGRIAILDRCTRISDLAYGIPQGLDADFLLKMGTLVPMPKIDMLFIISTNQAFGRMTDRGDECRIEARGNEFMTKVASIYNQMMNGEIGIDEYYQEKHAINGSQSIDEVHMDIRKEVERYLYPHNY